ncbi:anti-phage deoxyguanosine triphosphatase [Vibrio rumoiensis]|uniref:Deoxyguanosinetriphosphate triphosphohydrolase-like protein n=1 Tax=Vibrio rumoiensis 1S-45 TaxID=1188252 RepID=A0A1E5E3R1_9VIBR|nr:anti-phage deoxyguanosine triphosphatase [Vibrio rumoiensis]OEF26969.1 dGTPase [Vibrio rumoiensis 1S-45]
MEVKSSTESTRFQLTNNDTWQARINNEQKLRRNDHRDVYQRDRARVLHSAAFRRLQAKTQVHGTGLNDFYRTRLTHSLEVSQIGTGILEQLKRKQPEYKHLLPPASLIETLCLAHDIGHPPFGHGGEVALNYMLRNHGGFEGNAQTFRIVTQIEPYTEFYGMNLARRTLLGLLKYPALISQVHAQQRPNDVATPRQLKARDWLPAKGIYDIDLPFLNWVLEPLSEHDRALLATKRKQSDSNPYEHQKTRFKSLDCSIMELADDIAYGVHDLEDAIVLDMVNRKQWQEGAASKLADCGDEWFEKNIDTLSEKLFSGQHHERKDAIGGIVNALLTSIELKPVYGESEFDDPLLSTNAYLDAPMAYALDVFKNFVNRYVIHVPEVQQFEYKGQQIIMDIFEALNADPMRLLPDATKKKWQEAETDHQGGTRILADYISAMTDGYAQRMHQQLFSAHTSF